MVYVISFLLIPFLIWWLLVFPLWMVIHCLRRKDLAFAPKFWWSLALLGTWSFGCVFYAWLGSGEKRFPKFAALQVILGFVFMVMYFVTLNSAREDMLAALPELRETVTGISEGPSPAVRTAIADGLDVIGAEIAATPAYSALGQNGMTLLLLLRDNLGDQRLTENEAAFWLKQFQKREDTDPARMQELLFRES